MSTKSTLLETIKRNKDRAVVRKKEAATNWFCRVFHTGIRKIKATRLGGTLCKAYHWLQGPLAVVRTFSTLYTLAIFIVWVVSIL